MEDNTKTKQMFAVAMKKESDEESSSCPDGSFVATTNTTYERK
jgi:hypothetical protein